MSEHGRGLYEEVNPNGSGQVFECIVESPVVSTPNFRTGAVEYESGDRMRVVIEGKRELVQRVLAVAGPEVQAIVDELAAGRV